MQLLLWPDTDQDDTDQSKMLVTVVSDMCIVRITTPEAITESYEMEQGHYMTHDLKMDVMMMAGGNRDLITPGYAPAGAMIAR